MYFQRIQEITASSIATTPASQVATVKFPIRNGSVWPTAERRHQAADDAADDGLPRR
jgi:hypothetical protein